jgi:hypothetical protein
MARNQNTRASFPFHKGDTQWSGVVEVVRTTVTRDENTKEHLDLLLTVGHQRPIRIPFRDSEELIEAIKKGATEARQQYAKLIEELNKRKP